MHNESQIPFMAIHNRYHNKWIINDMLESGMKFFLIKTFLFKDLRKLFFHHCVTQRNALCLQYINMWTWNVNKNKTYSSWEFSSLVGSLCLTCGHDVTPSLVLCGSLNSSSLASFISETGEWLDTDADDCKQTENKSMIWNYPSQEINKGWMIVYFLGIIFLKTWTLFFF